MPMALNLVGFTSDRAGGVVSVRFSSQRLVPVAPIVTVFRPLNDQDSFPT